MNVLVTGGAGFIGSNFIRHILSEYKSVKITNLDSLTYAGKPENLRDAKDDPRYSFVHGDIRDTKTVNDLMKEGFDLVVNFAAETHVDRSIVKPGSFVLTDVYGVFTLLDAARRFDVERYLQISTDEVYGSIAKGSFKETDVLNPSSPYSASKASGDYITLAFNKTYGLFTVVTRSSNNYGPLQYPEKFIPKLILRAIHNQPLPIYGDGKQVRDWLHVTDNCAAIDLIAQYGLPGETYNVASGEEHTNMEIAKSIVKLLGKPQRLIKGVPDRPGHDRRYSLDTAKIEALGWKPRVKFAEGLAEAVAWYADNRWWWKALVKDEYFRSDTPWVHESEL